MAVQILAPSVHTPPQTKMTFAEFLDWCDEDTLAEFIEGEIVMTSPASINHQQVGSLLETLLRVHVEKHDLGKVLRAPFVMRLPELNRAREPDILFVAHANAHLLRPTFLDGAADLVVEIISPESFMRDHAEKFIEYERAGVPEYWLIDPERQVAEFYELGSAKHYQPALVADGIYRSRVVAGFWLRPAWLWQSPLPATLDLLREMKIL